MRNERRDYGHRAETMRAIVECLTQHTNGIDLQLLAVRYQVSPSAAERIVKRLAIRGLVRSRLPGVWSATPPLLHPASLLGAATLA
jgi:DNA-binding IclR family transcriptional regulator